PFYIRVVKELSMTKEQEAVAQGIATPEQKAAAKKQRRFIVTRRPYYPSMAEITEAFKWLADRGFGQAPKTVQIEGSVTTGFKMVFRRWAPVRRRRPRDWPHRTKVQYRTPPSNETISAARPILTHRKEAPAGAEFRPADHRQGRVITRPGLVETYERRTCNEEHAKRVADSARTVHRRGAHDSIGLSTTEAEHRRDHGR